jgi:hypothetical protein
MSPAGLAGAGYMGFAFEPVMGTPVQPTDPSTIWVPILDESLKYDEARYFSPQIRQQVMVSDVQQGYYHVSGDINLEVDPETFAQLMYASRHIINKVGSVAPYEYTFTPSTAGAASSGGVGLSKTATITIVRNGAGFQYFGCIFSSIKGILETRDGILKATLSVIGMGEAAPTGGLGTPVWVAPVLFGAAAHTMQRGNSGVTPTFAPVTSWDGVDFTFNHQAEPQNRIMPQRNASYVKYGELMIELNSTLDFIDRSDYNQMVATTTQAFQLFSVLPAVPTTTWATATKGVLWQINRGVFETYDIPLRGLADIVTATVTARGIGIVGGNAYELHVKTDVNITA